MRYISYEEAQEQVGYSSEILGKRPEKVYHYYAYKNGETFVCKTLDAAKKISNLVECVCINKEEINNYLIKQDNLLNKAFDLWFSSLRNYYVHHECVSPELFQICYNEAYEQRHSGGYDEIANKMDDVVDFARKILELEK